MEKIINTHNNPHQFLLISHYRIEQELSHKAGGKTFLAEDINSQTLVIIKVLLFNSFFQWDDFKLFEREANVLKNLDHSAIPKYLDYFEINEENLQGFALVQTYIEAPSLETAMKEGRKFSEGELIELAEKLLDILTYLHAQIPPLIHRDIKPSNILISNRSGNSVGDVYLVDFGSVQTVAKNKDKGTITIVGSYGYIPLEQFGGQTTTASDLYSLGMTLIYLVTGVHPAELSQVNGQVKFSGSDLSSQFIRWLEKMTHPHLDKRFDSAKLAKITLTSKDGSSGDHLHLRPANSQVKLYRDHHKLEIVYVYEVNSGERGCFFVIILWILVIYFFGWAYLFFGIFVSSTLWYSIWYFINKVFPSKPVNRIISIDLNGSIKTGTYKKSAKIKWEECSCSVRDINLLAYNPGYTFDKYLDETGKEIRRGTVKVNPKLSIYAGHLEYPILSQKLNQADLWWLGQELSDFLGLELQIYYPTPVVPPEPSCGGGC